MRLLKHFVCAASRTRVSHPIRAGRQKAEVMADHFHEQVWAKKKIGGKARAMIVTSSIDRAIAYYEELSTYLKENRRPYQAIVAFSDTERDGAKITEAQYNGFPSAEIPDRIQDCLLYTSDAADE